MNTRVLLFALSALLLSACGGGGSDSSSPAPGGGSATVPGLPTPPSALVLPWWNDAVFYEVFVRSFYDARSGNKANDGIGDFQGLIDQLDYLNDGNPNTDDDLGVNALWLMPILQSPSYHGYDTTDYYKIERDYGDNALFQRFMDECEQRGIRVIIDLVLNHGSSQHSFFTQSKNRDSQYRDWFLWEDSNPGWAGPWGQQVWHGNSGAYYYGVFWSGMPDWNFDNPEVTSYFKDVTRFWLEDMKVDGFRLDAIRHLIEDGADQEDTDGTHDWLRDYFLFYKDINPDAFTVGEVWADSNTVATYQGQMDTNFQFDLAGAILSAVNGGNGFALEGQLQTVWDNFEHGQFATFLTNHDQNRVMDQLGNDVTKAKLAATILLTIPGVPFIYYGEEVGMIGAKPDENIRRPMQWNAGTNAGFSTANPWHTVNSNYREFNVSTMRSDPDSLFNLYRRLVHIRTQNPAIARGNFTRVACSESNVLTFLRQTEDQSVLVIYNIASVAISDYVIALDGDYNNAEELLNNATLAKGDQLSKDGVNGFKPIAELAPRTGYIIRF